MTGFERKSYGDRNSGAGRSDSRRDSSSAGADAGASGMSGGFGGGFRRRKTCPFTGPSAPKIDYKDVKLLQRFVTERGKIIPARISAVSTKKQRELAQAIKRARYLGLMPYAAQMAGGQERD